MSPRKKNPNWFENTMKAVNATHAILLFAGLVLGCWVWSVRTATVASGNWTDIVKQTTQNKVDIDALKSDTSGIKMSLSELKAGQQLSNQRGDFIVQSLKDVQMTLVQIQQYQLSNAGHSFTNGK